MSYNNYNYIIDIISSKKLSYELLYNMFNKKLKFSKIISTRISRSIKLSILLSTSIRLYFLYFKIIKI